MDGTGQPRCNCDGNRRLGVHWFHGNGTEWRERRIICRVFLAIDVLRNGAVSTLRSFILFELQERFEVLVVLFCPFCCRFQAFHGRTKEFGYIILYLRIEGAGIPRVQDIVVSFLIQDLIPDRPFAVCASGTLLGLLVVFGRIVFFIGVEVAASLSKLYSLHGIELASTPNDLTGDEVHLVIVIWVEIAIFFSNDRPCIKQTLR
jgi:hypothetical protein